MVSGVVGREPVEGAGTERMSRRPQVSQVRGVKVRKTKTKVYTVMEDVGGWSGGGCGYME